MEAVARTRSSGVIAVDDAAILEELLSRDPATEPEGESALVSFEGSPLKENFLQQTSNGVQRAWQVGCLDISRGAFTALASVDLVL